MGEYFNWLNALVNKSKSEFSTWPDLKWLNVYEAFEALELRADLLEQTKNSQLFKATKPYYKQISKGCQICGEGQWSCLFITGKCNAKCFYCPVPQTHDEVPGTQGLDFKTPEEFAHYVKRFGFKGVSFSGGEPLLPFERTLSYLKAVRKICDKGLYVWAYTNGILADREKMQKLADAGLDEIRFDIGATGFKLDKIAFAKGLIPNITIEIPAVPEEKEKLMELLPQMIEAGVTNLNLHQLRLTPHNVKHLSKRDYTYIPAEKPIVLESELAALEIIAYAKENDLNIGINYCSFFFKYRFQKAGFRKQIATALQIPAECISERGYIREISDNSILYKTIKVLPEQPVFGEYEEMDVEGQKYYIQFPIVFSELNLSQEEKHRIDVFLQNPPIEVPDDELLFKIWQMEYMEEGLREW